MSTLWASKLGAEGERLAAEYLEKHGYVILARNYRCRHFGELDIIARNGAVLAFIEVKTRATYLYGRPCEAVTRGKQKKIYRCAEYYMQQNGISSSMPQLSFDVIEIIMEGTRVREFKHYPACF